MLHAEPLAVAPDPHRLLAFYGLGLTAAGRAPADRSPLTLLFLGISHERRPQPLFMAPDAIGRVHRLYRSVRVMQHHQQRAELCLLPARTAGQLGHEDHHRSSVSAGDPDE
jgi:hypothetical protein